MYTVYGIANCDSVKKATNWLNSNHIPFEFHDYKKKGITEGRLKKWTRQVNWETLVNKKGTTWRGLAEETKAGVTSEAPAIALMIENTSLIKRPVIEMGNKVFAVGFDEEAYKKAFG